jgi:hypothetical protein
MMDIESNVKRIEKIARGGLETSTEDDPENLRMDSFVIAINFVWDEDGEEHEATAVYGESRRHYAKLGILHEALGTLDEKFSDDTG